MNKSRALVNNPDPTNSLISGPYRKRIVKFTKQENENFTQSRPPTTGGPRDPSIDLDGSHTNPAPTSPQVPVNPGPSNPAPPNPAPTSPHPPSNNGDANPTSPQPPAPTAPPAPTSPPTQPPPASQTPAEKQAEQVKNLPQTDAGVDDFIALVCPMTPGQRADLKAALQNKHQIDIVFFIQQLVKDKPLEELLVGLFTERWEFWASRLNRAVKGLGTDEVDFVDLTVLCERAEQPKLDAVYKGKYGTDLQGALSGDDLGKSVWGRVLRGLLGPQQPVAGSAAEVAEVLYKAAKGLGTDEDKFIAVYANVNAGLYREVAAAYEAQYKKKLRDVICSEFSSYGEYCLTLLHDVLCGLPLAVATVLKKAMKGAGTDETKLNYATVLFADKIKSQIVGAYKDQGYGDLKKDIIGDTSKAYQKALLLCWGLY
uniref:Annexin 1 n=1 Tax=Spironucleus vortens TaxID=58336 RepID=A0A142C669_SPIVO|nr:annexin 1 [Spironucleus vortens]